jgi:hypothetical protein
LDAFVIATWAGRIGGAARNVVVAIRLPLARYVNIESSAAGLLPMMGVKPPPKAARQALKIRSVGNNE